MCESGEWTISFEALVRRVMLESVQPLEEARKTARQLVQLHEDLRKPFHDWFVTGNINSNVQASGYSIERILDEVVTIGGVPCAFLWLDALLKDPEGTLSLIGLKVSGFRPTAFSMRH